MSVHRLARTRFAAGVAALTAITAVVWLVLWAAVVPLVRGWSPVAVVSGSMAPLIDSGDIVVAAPYEGERLDAGAVIVFDNPTGTGSMTHRVVDVTPAGEYVTRGDANGHIDSTPVPPDTIQGVGRILVPAIATPFVWANNSQWTHLIVAAIAILAAVWASRWALLARHNPWSHRPAPPVTNSITTIGALLGIWPTTPQPATIAVAQTTNPATTPPPTQPGRGPQRLAVTAIAVAAVASAALVAPNLIQSQAAFTNAPDNTANSWIADTLTAPTGLNATADGADIDLDWTATVDTWATGHRLYRSTSPGGPYSQIAQITPRTTTTYTDVGPGSGGAPVFESVATAIQGPSSGLSVTVARPAGTTDGDLLVAVIGIDSSNEDSLPIGAPAGWTQIFQEGNEEWQAALGVWYRIASSEPASYLFTWGEGEEGFGAIQRYSGAHATTPINAWDYNGVTVNAFPTAPDVITTVSDTLVLRIVGVDGTSHVEPSPLSSIHPAGTTPRFELITDPTGSGGTFGSGSDHTQATAGPTGTALFTVTGSDGWIAATIAIRPAAVVAPTYYYTARAYYLSWESVNSNEATVTVATEDYDAIVPASDNCPTTFNIDQYDTDNDSTGDACDPSPTVASGASFSSGQSLSPDVNGLEFADLDGDGDLDLVYAREATDRVMFNDGTGTFGSPQSLGPDDGEDVALGDLDGDGDIDAVFANYDAPDTVWLNNGTGTFSDSGQSLGNASGRGVALADVDGDGDLDMIVVNSVDEPNTVWLNNGTATFTDTGQTLGAVRTRGVALGDVDGDGDIDAMFANAFSYSSGLPNTVWFNDGTGTYTDSGQTLGNAPSYAVALADFDGDGALDAVYANSDNVSRVWLNNGTGTFTDSGEDLGTADSLGVAVGDLDGDGDIDVMLANDLGQGNRIWFNEGTATFTSSSGIGTSDSAAVALGDLDGDGDLDAAFGNWNFDSSTIRINS